MPSAERPSNTVCSYMSVHDDLGAKSKGYAGKYQQFVLDYATEWEKVVRTRIDAGIKKAEELRIELDHYQKKYEALRLTANQNMAKGKTVPSGHQEKLTRNEEKLMASKQGYNKVATDLCILMEEVTERSWRDLHPLLVKVAQFDMTLANDEAKALAPLQQVVASLKQVATENGLSAQPRLKDLAGLKPELLSTRPGGVAGLAIEAGPAYGSFGSPNSSFEQQTALPPGSVGPQGMGGFPVQIASSPNNNSSSDHQFGQHRSQSVGSFHSAPLPPLDHHSSGGSSFHMLTIQATAPAPTLDDVYGTGGFPNSTRSAPSSGNYSLPPLNPSPSAPMTSWNVRSSSFNDADSTYSGFSAPASAPPPPPSMPPPPPPMPPSYGGLTATTSTSSYLQQQQPSGGFGSSPWSSSSQQQPQQFDPMSLYQQNPSSAPQAAQPNPHYNPFG